MIQNASVPYTAYIAVTFNLQNVNNLISIINLSEQEMRENGLKREDPTPKGLKDY